MVGLFMPCCTSFPRTIPCPFFVGRVKRQRNPTLMLGYGYGFYVATQAIATLWLTPRSASVNIPQSNLQIKTFFRFGQGIARKNQDALSY